MYFVLSFHKSWCWWLNVEGADDHIEDGDEEDDAGDDVVDDICSAVMLLIVNIKTPDNQE